MSAQPSGVIDIQTPRAFLPLLGPSRYKAAHGGRGGGKSHFFAELMVEENIYSKLDNVCLREVQKSLEFSVKKLIEQKIAKLNAGDYFEVQDKRILTKKGGIIIFEGLQNHTKDSIKSLEGFDRAWGEEAQSFSQRSLNILRPTIRKPGSEMWFSWNPGKPTDPIDAFFRGETHHPDATIIEVNYDGNPWFTDEMRADMEYDRRRDPDMYAHVWLGQYEARSEARVFHNWIIEEFERPEGTIFRLGADWGFASDPSVLVRCSIEGNILYIDHEAYMVGCEIVHLPDLFSRVPQSTKWFITADSARPETISHMRKNGYPKINAALKGKNSLAEGVEFLKSFDIVVHPRCRHAIDELTNYKYKVDPMTDAVLPVLEDKHNHVIDALRYACEGIRRTRKGRHYGTNANQTPDQDALMDDELAQHRVQDTGGWMSW